MSKYLHSLSIASVSGQKYASYFKNRAKTLDYSNALYMNHFYKGYIGKSIKSGQFINTKVIDSNVCLVGILATFNEVQWLQQQAETHVIELNTGRDVFNPNVKNKIKEGSIKIKREPKKLGYLYYSLGSESSEKPYVEYRASAVERSIISVSENIRYKDNNTGSLDGWNDADSWPDGYKGAKRSRCWSYFFIERGIARKELKGNGYLGNLAMTIFENSNTLKQLDISIAQRKPRGGALLPYIAIGGSYAMAYNSLRIMGGVCFCENPNPEILKETSTSITYKDYYAGYGQAALFIFVLDTRNGSYTPIRLQVTPTHSSEEAFFYLEKYEENADKWRDAASLISVPPKEGGKWLGYLPNLLGQPLIVGTSKGFAIYLSGVRSHYSERTSTSGGGTYNVYDSQTAVLRVYFKLREDGALAFEETKVIEHDASGNSQTSKKFGGTDGAFWNIYHTLWADTVGDKEIVLVSNTRHKRYDEAAANYAGESSIEDMNDPDTNLETFFHLYIDGKIYKFDTAKLKFGANLISENDTTYRHHKYLWLYADIFPITWGRKYGTVISDTEVLFCFRSYPKHEENLLVKFDIETQTFEVLKRTPKADGDIVATCYQKKVTDKNGKEIIPAGIIYRVGTQGKSGKVYISKDSAKTFHKIIDSPYTAGGGLYFLGNEFYAINYSNAFADNNNKKS
ncbi:hypothetical protein [Entomomonas asaccharolytica]|uniref:Uncharacterized protein n=1 Tax=Entomomonas asaccharolytica TaxID=2785331 RepID=A0A974NEP3_9GAMM|nr:hypothetical protein [Entomomonas asaccharolytica]QQP85007.1 hypothetical protein JHT90_11500 [Entomomonas asaccharolytica]